MNSNTLARAAFCFPFLWSIAPAATPDPPVEAPPEAISADDLLPGVVQIELIAGVPEKPTWEFDRQAANTRFTQTSFALSGYPHKYTSTGVIADRANPFLLRASARRQTTVDQAGQYELVLRSRGAARLFVDGRLLLQTKFMTANASGHEEVPQVEGLQRGDLRPLPPGCQEQVARVQLDEGPHDFVLEAIVGGRGLRLEVNDLCVALARRGEPLRLLTADPAIEIAATEGAWQEHVEQLNDQLRGLNRQHRQQAAAQWEDYWRHRHEIARQVVASMPAIDIPDVSSDWPVRDPIDRFVGAEMAASGLRPAEPADDHAFLRRVTLDTVGVVPSRAEIAAFGDDNSTGRRARVIDRLLLDPRWADHWVSYWQDVLAENPGVLKPKLNNTGPFRWWIYESLRDNKPIDRFTTELVMMEGSAYYGGPAGFAMATQNDVPLAAKAHVLAQAFLGVEMKCARCHDAPYHPYRQEQLFNLAAMLRRKPLPLPETSTVPANPGGRQPAIEISLKPGERIAPHWPFEQWIDGELPDDLLRDPGDTRERLAALLTSPHNRRFAQVIVNRLWARYMGRGLVEPVDDWPSDDEPADVPPLLEYLARELVRHDYDLKHVARKIINSSIYQSKIASGGDHDKEMPSAAPVRRRLTAEQIVDSLYVVSGKEIDSEWLTLDPEGRKPVEAFLNLGLPSRAWQFTSLSNERDRPALALPVAQSVVDLLLSYGWRDARPNPITHRDETPTLLQPLALANGIVGRRAVRLSEDSALTGLCLEDIDLPSLLEEVSLQVLSRPPSCDEREMFAELLAEGYATRVVPGAKPAESVQPGPRNAVSWSNHLSAEATEIKLELQRAVEAGDPPTTRLDADWRERMEDVVWAMLNSPEFVFVP